MENNTKFLNECLTGKLPFSKFCKENNITKEELVQILVDNEYFYVLESNKRSGIVKMHDAAIEFINISCENTTFTTIAKKYGLEHTRFRKYLEKYYPQIKLKKDLYFDESVFDVIDTEEKAYWLGFMCADGTISSSPKNPEVKTEFKIELSLASKDLSHLEKFAAFIKYRKAIYCNDKRCRIFLNSERMWKSLYKHGCIPQKTLKLQFPVLDQPLIRHFIRGYWDGDGCLTWCNKEHTCPEISVISTEDVLLNILSFLKLESKIFINPSTYEFNPLTKKFHMYSHKAFIACYKLYENSNIYLQRKYNTYKEYCRLYWELYRQLQTKNGELWDENTVQSLKTKRFKPVQSVETEPEISE